MVIGVGEGLRFKLVLDKSRMPARYLWVSPVIMFPFYKSQREALAWPREFQRGKAPFPASHQTCSQTFNRTIVSPSLALT